MSSHDPDQTESSGSYNGESTTAKTADGNTQRGAFAYHSKKKVFVKKQYHGVFGGTTKFEGRIEVLKTAVYDFIRLCQPKNSMFRLQER